MDDPVISCISYVVKKTCLTFGKLLQFLGLRLLDLIGLVFNILALCTIVRIPGLIEALFDSHEHFKWTWKYAGIWQLAVFVFDLPLLATLPFYLLCPWRIYLVCAGAQKKNEFKHFYWEGWSIRCRIYKHFILLIFDILSIPFTICLALSWRSVRAYNLYSKSDKKETTVKFVIVCQFLHLISDIIFLPFVFILMVSWRSPIVLKKYWHIYFEKDKPNQPNEIDFEMKGVIINQIWNLLLDLFTIPPMLITLLSWRIVFFFSSCVKKDKQSIKQSLNTMYIWIRWKFWQNALYFVLDLPCLLALVLLVALFPILPWRLVQYFTGFKKRVFAAPLPPDTSELTGMELRDQMNTEGKGATRRQMHERKLLLITYVVIAGDLLSIIAALFSIVTLWRLPFLVYDLRKLYKSTRSTNEGMIRSQYQLEKSTRIWAACFINFILIFVDLLCVVAGLVVVGTLWRAYPLLYSIKSAFTPKAKETDEGRPLENISIFTVSGMKIRRNIAKNFIFLLVDIPAIALCFLHIPFMIKLPAIVSVIVGGNFYLEFAVTVYIQTAKLLVDLVFLMIFFVMAFVRPIAIWVNVLEDERHKKYRLSADWWVHIKWLLKHRQSMIQEAESLLYILVKESQNKTGNNENIVQPYDSVLNVDEQSEQKYAVVSLAKVVTKYTKKLDKIRNILAEEELDDRLMYHVSKVIFFENKAAHMMGRRFMTEKMFLANPSVIAYRRNMDLLKKEELLYEERRDDAIESLKKFKFEQVPLWENVVGFRERTRKETQKAIIAAVTSGNFVTLLLCSINTLFLYRAPSMFKSICHAPHLRRNIAIKTLKNYLLDLLMMAKILLICLSIYKVPDLISALVVSFVQKRSIKAARKAVDSIPSDMLEDLYRALAILFSWSTIAYTCSSVLFFLLMPLSVMVKTYTAMFNDICAAYFFAGLLYIVVVVAPFVLPLMLPGKIASLVTMNAYIAGYMLLLVLILTMFVILKTKTFGGNSLQVKSIDYVRINWFNIHVYFKLFIEFLELIALVFSVKMAYFQHYDYFAKVSKHILLDVYDSKIKFALACAVFILWFFTASIPIVLEGILKYVGKGTFSKSHFTWRAFLSFFGTTLFMFIPEVSLSFLACNYSNCSKPGYDSATCAVLMDDPEMVCWSKQHQPYAVMSLFGMMWYLLTSTLICLSFNDALNRKMDLQFSPIYTAIENIFKVGIITAITLFKDSIYSLIATGGLLIILILITCLWSIATKSKVANSIRLIVWKLGSLVIVLCCSIVVIVVEMLEISGSVVLYGLAGIIGAIIIGCMILSCSGFGLVMSEQERARGEFKKLVTKMVVRVKSLDAFVTSWKHVQFPFKRMLRHVRVAHPKDKTFEVVVTTDADGQAVTNLMDIAPPSYEDLPLLDAPPEPPSYDSILSQKQTELQADEYFVPDASIYLSPFGDWTVYDSSNILDKDGWMIALASDSMMELTDTQCTGSDLLLLLEQHIKYTSQSYEFVQSLGTWRQTVKKSTWTGLLQCAQALEASIDSSFDRPIHGSITYDPEKDLISVNPDLSTFPMYFELMDVTSIKMVIHERELRKLLAIIPEPWLSVFEKVIPKDRPVVKRVKDYDASQPSHFSVDLFKQVNIIIKNIDSGGFKIARGAKLVLPKTMNIANISSTNLALSKPYLSGSKGPITKHVDSLNAKKIGEHWYVVVGNNRAKFSKLLATLHELEYC